MDDEIDDIAQQAAINEMIKGMVEGSEDPDKELIRSGLQSLFKKKQQEVPKVPFFHYKARTEDGNDILYDFYVLKVYMASCEFRWEQQDCVIKSGRTGDQVTLHGADAEAFRNYLVSQNPGLDAELKHIV